jgi:hypothetical protein
MFGGKGGKGTGAAAAATDDSVKNPPAKYQGGGAAAGASGGGGGGARRPGPAIIQVDTLCKHSLGRGAEFDGVDSCRCSAGYTHKGGQCVADTNTQPAAAAASSRPGAAAAAAGIKPQDPAFDRYNQMCKSDWGPYAEFDGNGQCRYVCVYVGWRVCVCFCVCTHTYTFTFTFTFTFTSYRCMDGYEDVGGKCTRAYPPTGTQSLQSGSAGGSAPSASAAARAAEKAKNDKLCQAQWPNSMFDGVCVCVCVYTHTPHTHHTLTHSLSLAHTHT